MFRGSCQLRWLGLGRVNRERRISYLMSVAAMAVAASKIGDVYCLPAPAHQPFSSNSLGLIAPEGACSRNVRASGTLKLGYEVASMKVFLRLYD